MSIEKFVCVDDNPYVVITGGTDTGEILNMSGAVKEHHIAIRFKDVTGADVVPTAGTVQFQGSQFRDPYWNEVCDGFFNAADVNDDSRPSATVGGPMRAFKVTLDGVAGAAAAVIKVTSF